MGETTLWYSLMSSISRLFIRLIAPCQELPYRVFTSMVIQARARWSRNDYYVCIVAEFMTVFPVNFSNITLDTVAYHCTTDFV